MNFSLVIIYNFKAKIIIVSRAVVLGIANIVDNLYSDSEISFRLRNVIPEPVARSAAPGLRPERGLLILRRESHPILCVGLV